jgi:hypothetical protein
MADVVSLASFVAERAKSRDVPTDQALCVLCNVLVDDPCAVMQFGKAVEVRSPMMCDTLRTVDSIAY